MDPSRAIERQPGGESGAPGSTALPTILERIKARTPARILTGRAGSSYRTSTYLELRADHAAARDAVTAELDLEADLGAAFVRKWELFEVPTLAHTKAEYLLRPELGRSLDPAAKAAITALCPAGVELQAAIADGLSAAAVRAQVPALLPRIADEAARRGWRVIVTPVPAGLHNRPEKIPAAVEGAGLPAVVAYADCGTYGKLDELCARQGIRRLPGLHCYDIYAGPDTVRELFHMEPGTYLLTDYLVRTFDRTVVASLGLDRYPELWPDYFGHYTRVAWLAQEPTPELAAEAERIAALFGLPLTTITTGLARLEAALAELIERGES